MTGRAPRVSVMIAAFEAHETIGRRLESLRAQTFRDFEVILIDSSSGQSTAEITALFPETRFDRSTTRLYPHEARNRGASSALHQ